MKPSTFFGILGLIGAIFWIPLPMPGSYWAMVTGGLGCCIWWVFIEGNVIRTKKEAAK